MRRLRGLLKEVLRRRVRCPTVRSPTAGAAETVALVLDASVPLPTCQTDIADLVERLQIHIVELTGLLAPEGLNSAPEKQGRLLVQAGDLRRREVPPDYVGSRIHLVRLAESVQCLLVCAAADERAFDGQATKRHSQLDQFGVARHWASLWRSTSDGVRWICHR